MASDDLARAHRIGPTAALVFAVAIAAAVYVGMEAGCFLHEIAGHGGTATRVGGRFWQFRVDATAHGYARYRDVPDHLEWAPLWGGIAVNLLTGIAAAFVLGRRRFASIHLELLLLALVITAIGLWR